MSAMVLCRLKAGLVIEQDGQVAHLTYGFNEDADVELTQRWLKRNSRLACVRDGQICIVEDGAAPRKARDIRKEETA